MKMDLESYEQMLNREHKKLQRLRAEGKREEAGDVGMWLTGFIAAGGALGLDVMLGDEEWYVVREEETE